MTADDSALRILAAWRELGRKLLEVDFTVPELVEHLLLSAEQLRAELIRADRERERGETAGR
jgi:hypothetical protein